MKKVLLVLIILIFSIVNSFSQTISDVLENALPSVVTVAIYKTEEASKILGFGDAKVRGDDLDKAYEKVLDLSGAQSSGSGFVIERQDKKYVVTNAHVIDIASSDKGSIVVYSINRTKYNMELIGGDTFYDIAVLKFEDNPGNEISSIDFRTTEIRIGEQVYAIGNPLGKFPNSVSEGIISGKNRMREGIIGKLGFLQTTATITWGNSGGPLIDVNGYVVGINSQMEIVPGQYQAFVQPQINFALESTLCNRLVEDIINYGKIKRAYIGIELSQTYIYNPYNKYSTDEWELINDIPIISGTIKGSPADESGRLNNKIGYEIIEINNSKVRNIQEALYELEKVIPGDIVSLTIIKDDERENLNVKSTILESNELAQIVHHAFKTFKQLSLKSNDDGVYINAQKYSTEWKIISAGIAIDDNNKFMWKINNMADLGAALRFSGLYGIINLCVVKKGDYEGNANIETMYISGNENNFKNTVWY